MEDYDFFLSHASADKAEFVRPLAEALGRAGFRVWYDDLSIKPGDSIRRSIDDGIAKARAGIVVLSRAFFNRPWPQAELDALLSLSIGQKKHVIPIWLNIDRDAVAAISPLMADKKAIMASAPMGGIVDAIRATLPIESLSDDEIECKLLAYYDERFVNQQRLICGCWSRLCAIAQLGADHQAMLDSTDEAEDEASFEERMQSWNSDVHARLRIPQLVYIDSPYPLGNTTLRLLLSDLNKWVRGKLGWRETGDLYYWLDEKIDADYLYIFFDIPLQQARVRQLERLHEAIIDIGVRRRAPDERVGFHKAVEYALRNVQ